MTEDDSQLPGTRPDERGDSALLLYDFFKHLTSLSLFTLGGVLAIAQGGDKADIAPFMLIIVLLIISGGGICSFVGAGEIVRMRYTGTPSKSLEFHRKAAPSLLAVGVGMFLGIYLDALS